jgi:hypothetical protein
MTSTVRYGKGVTFLLVDDIRTQGKHLWAYMAYYVHSFTFLCADGVRTAQEVKLWATTTCYGDSFTFLYVDYALTSQEAHTGIHGVTGIALRFYIQMMFVPHRKHTYGSPRPVTEIALLCFHFSFVFSSLEKLMWAIDAVCN